MPKPEWNPPSAPEAQARAQIDEQLIAAGWIIQNYKALNLGAGQGIALREVPLKTGPCDYLLLVDRRPIGVIEAKKMGTTLSGVADQSANYAENLPDFLAKLLPAGIAGLPFLYESTGVETLFRDERDPEPRSRRVFTFHRPETFAGWLVEPDTLRARLAAMPIAHPLPAQNLRDCQIEGITHLEESFTAARPRALIQMATGAGKTYTACSFTYRLIKHGGAKRVLFLVDRANLGRQAMAEFQHFVAPDTGRKFTEVYNVQHLTLQPARFRRPRHHLHYPAPLLPPARRGTGRGRRRKVRLRDRHGRRPPQGRRLQSPDILYFTMARRAPLMAASVPAANPAAPSALPVVYPANPSFDHTAIHDEKRRAAAINESLRASRKTAQKS
jgi:hypothetical protein